MNLPREGAVAVLLGGSSAEREISLQSGQAVLAALQESSIAATPLDPAKESLSEQLSPEEYACAFIALHGPGGEDGTVQGVLELLGLPYTGSGAAASALAGDKFRCKSAWRDMGLPTPPFVRLTPDSDWQAVLERLGQLIVKPVHGGSSLGMNQAGDAGALEDAFHAAQAYDEEVLAEQWIEGTDCSVGILGEQSLPVVRIETEHPFYNYEAKYQDKTTSYHCPAGLDPEEEQRMRALALTAFQKIGCQGWGRVDLMRDRDGNCHLLEVNTVPGLTEHSLLPMAAKAADINFRQLVGAVLNTAWERGK